MNSEVLVSICCITYNHAPYIRQCLDGFVMQKTNFQYEILIHDDASTDGTADIIREYESKYPGLIKPIYQIENQYSKGKNISATYNWPRAIGKYIAQCEGDDYWTDPLKLQKQVDFLESHPEYSMCFHRAEIKIQGVDRSKCGARCEYVQDKEYSATDLFAEWIVPTASIVYDRQRVNQYSIKHPKWATRGDIILVLKCAHVGKVWGMSDKMSVYRMQPNSVSHNPKYRNPETYKLPNHFRCIYINFPEVSKNVVTWNISHAYYSRMKVKNNYAQKVLDFILFLYWNPVFAYAKIKEIIDRKILKH